MYTAIPYKHGNRMVITRYGTRITQTNRKHYRTRFRHQSFDHDIAFFSGSEVCWAPPKLNGPNVDGVAPPAVGAVEPAKSPPGFAEPKPKSGGGATNPSCFCSPELRAVGLLLLVWNLKVVGAPNTGADVALELEGVALKPANPLNAAIAGLSPSFPAKAALPKVGAPNPVNLGALVAPAAKPLKPPAAGLVAPDDTVAAFKPALNVGPDPSVLVPLKSPLALGCSVVVEVVATLDAFAEGPKNPPFRFGGVAAAGDSVEARVEVAALAEGPKNPPFLRFGGSESVGVGAGAGAAALEAAPLIENPPNRVGGADPSVGVFTKDGTSFPSPMGGCGFENSELPLAGVGTEELLRALNARTCLPNGPSALKLGAGFGRGRLIPGKAGLGGSAGWVAAVVVAETGTGATGGAPKRPDEVGCEDGGAKRENNDPGAGGCDICEGLVSSLGSGAGLGAPKPLKPLKPVEPVVGADEDMVGLLNAPKNAPPAGLAASPQAGGAPKSEPVVGAAVTPGAWGALTLLKSDPPFGTVGVVRLGVETAPVAPGLPKFAKSPDAFTADVGGAIAVVLGTVGAGNAPKSEETLVGSVYAGKHQ